MILHRMALWHSLSFLRLISFIVEANAFPITLTVYLPSSVNPLPLE